jgi:ketosteroid isomerase-like protein
MNRPIAFVLGVSLIGGVVPAHAQRADSAAAVATVEQFHSALAGADSARAVGLLADDVLILESGAIQTRAEYLGGHLGADMKASQGAKGERTVLKVTVVGDVAYVVSKTVTPPTGAQGSTGSESAELMIVTKTATGWKIRAVHWSSRRRRA